ncbi:hypothetical protein Tco_0344715 [Tanacetum coccineum]
MHEGSKQIGLKQLGSKQVGFKQLGHKQVGFKQLGPGVEIGVHGLQDEKRVWFEVELQGAQRNRETEDFQVSNNDVAVAQRRLEDKQLEKKTNTDCLVKEQEKVHLGIKVGANIMVAEIPGQEGAKGNVAEKKKVKESMEANLGKLLKYNAWSTRWSPVRLRDRNWKLRFEHSGGLLAGIHGLFSGRNCCLVRRITCGYPWPELEGKRFGMIQERFRSSAWCLRDRMSTPTQVLVMRDQMGTPTQYMSCWFDWIELHVSLYFVIVFIDNILATPKSKEEHEVLLKLVLESQRKEKLYAKVSKLEGEVIKMVRGIILQPKSEAFKQENVLLVGSVMDEAHASRYLVHPGGADKTYYNLGGHVLTDQVSSFSSYTRRFQDVKLAMIYIDEDNRGGEKLKAVRDRQKSYADKRRKPLEFEKCLADANLHVPLDEIKVDKTLRFVEEPIEIMD